MKGYHSVLLIAFALTIGGVCATQARQSDARFIVQTTTVDFEPMGTRNPRPGKLYAPARRSVEQRMRRSAG